MIVFLEENYFGAYLVTKRCCFEEVSWYHLAMFDMTVTTDATAVTVVPMVI